MKWHVCLVAAVALFVSSPALVSAQKMDVKVTNSQVFQNNLSGVIPGTCSRWGCTWPVPVSYAVEGASLWLLMPDGRTAVVSCNWKYQLKFDGVNSRSCRIPDVDHLQANFRGNDVKLRWQGQYETYTLVEIRN
ncbi:MAG: hypothetical protein ABSG51_18340 [Terracidiphilus sp.]|jgi:hypothetical protein